MAKKDSKVGLKKHLKSIKRTKTLKKKKEKLEQEHLQGLSKQLERIEKIGFGRVTVINETLKSFGLEKKLSPGKESIYIRDGVEFKLSKINFSEEYLKKMQESLAETIVGLYGITENKEELDENSLAIMFRIVYIQEKKKSNVYRIDILKQNFNPNIEGYYGE